jgi:hypothetical protein
MIPKQYTTEKEGISRTNIKYEMLYNRKKDLLQLYIQTIK